MAFVNSTLVVANDTTVTANVPTGTANGHLMLMVCTKATGSSTPWNTPTGWTQVFDEYNSGGAPDRQGAVFYKIASSEPASYSVSHTGTADRMEVSISTYDSIDNTTPLDVVYSNGSHHGYTQNSFNVTFRDITTVTDGATVVCIHFAGDDDITAAGAPTGYTTRVDGSRGTTGDPNSNDAQHMTFDKVIAIAGLESPGTTTHSGSSTLQDNDYWTLALRPGAPAAVASVDDVDTDETTVDGQSAVSVTVSDFGSDITSIIYTNTTYDTANLLASGTGDNYTINLPDVSAYSVDTAGVPFGTLDCEATDGTDTATLSVTHNPKAGWATTTVASSATGAGSIFTRVFADGSQIYYNTANNTSVAATGIYTTDGTEIDGAVWDIDTGLWEPFTVTIGTPDTEAPTVPTGLNAVSTGATTGTVSWTASTDNVAVTGYRVFLDAVEVGTTAMTSFNLTGLDPATTYAVTVSAYDAAANESSQSTADNFTTDTAPDSEAPTVPTGVNAIATGHTTGYVSWNQSTDNVGVTGYRVFLDSVDQGTTTDTNAAFGGLTASTLYSVTVAAFDAIGNESAQSTADTFTTNAEPAPGDTTIFRVNSGGQPSLNLMS